MMRRDSTPQASHSKIVAHHHHQHSEPQHIKAVSVEEACIEPPVPETFFLRQDTWTGRYIRLYYVESGAKRYGEVVETWWSWTTEFVWQTANAIVCRGHMKTWSWGRTVDVVDCNHRKIARVAQDAWSLFDRFTISTPNGTKVGESRRVNWGWYSTKHFDIVSPAEKGQQRTLVHMELPYFSYGARWQAQVMSNSTQADDKIARDPRVIVMLAALMSTESTSWSTDVGYFFILVFVVLFACVCVFTRGVEDDYEKDRSRIMCFMICCTFMVFFSIYGLMSYWV